MNEEISRLQRLRNKLRVRQRAKQLWQQLLRRAGFLKGNWAEALPEELHCWEYLLKEEGRHWVPEEYRRRMDPQFEFQEELKRLIHVPPGTVIRVLDVGAGPLTSLGKKWEGRNLQLFPVDPLAEEYKAVLARLKIQPTVLTETGYGERLLEKFEKNSFDLACASNSLDHCENPLLAIRQMLAVVRPGCYVYLSHYASVGVNEGYQGLHQWNFAIKHGDVVLSDGRGVRHSLVEEFKDAASLECETQMIFGSEMIIARLKKTGSP